MGVPGGEAGVQPPEGAGADPGPGGGTGEGQATGPGGAGIGEGGAGERGVRAGDVAGGELGQPLVEEEVTEAESEFQVRYKSKSKAPAGSFTIPAKLENIIRVRCLLIKHYELSVKCFLLAIQVLTHSRKVNR